MAKIVEIRSLWLRSGTRDRFHDALLPRARKLDLVAHGPSLHDDDSYFVIRAFASLEDRARDDDEIVDSADVERVATVVVRVDDETFEAFASLVTGRPYLSRFAWRGRRKPPEGSQGV